MEVSLLFILIIFIYVSKVNGVESHPTKPPFKCAVIFGVNFSFRSLINKGTNDGLKSHSFKIFLFTTMTFGLVIMSYYKAQMNAALNAGDQEFPIKSWIDVSNSNYKVLTWMQSASETKFLYAPNGSALNNIYHEKIITVPEEEQLQSIKLKGSIKPLLTGDYIVYNALEPYMKFKEFPCEITYLKSIEMRQVYFLHFHVIKTYYTNIHFLDAFKRCRILYIPFC